MNNIVFERPQHLSEEIVIVDGVSAAGKLLISLYLQTFDRVQKMEHNHIYGYLAATHFHKKITKDATIELMNLTADTMLTGSMLSRDINFRIFDDSSVFRTPKKWQYIKRAFRPDGDVLLDYVKKEKPILHIVTHFSGISKELFFEAFQDRLKFISVVRHPMYMFDWWVNNFKMYGKLKREYGLLIKSKSEGYMPWYAIGCFDDYDSMTVEEKVVCVMEWIINETLKSDGNLTPSQKKNHIVIPYEHFVTDTHKYGKILQESLSCEKTKSTDKFLKKQRLPSASFSGRKFKRTIFGNKVGPAENDYNAHKELVNHFKKICSKKAFDNLLRISVDYEEKFDIRSISTKDYI
jgi:hypothetical protein